MVALSIYSISSISIVSLELEQEGEFPKSSSIWITNAVTTTISPFPKYFSYTTCATPITCASNPNSNNKKTQSIEASTTFQTHLITLVELNDIQLRSGKVIKPNHSPIIIDEECEPSEEGTIDLEVVVTPVTFNTEQTVTPVTTNLRRIVTLVIANSTKVDTPVVVD